MEERSSALAALTARMAAGEEAAFTTFHAAYFPRLFRYVLVLLRGDEPAARDVTQETLLRVVRYVRRFEDEQIFWDWLARLARSAAADQGRRATRYRRLLEVFGFQSVAASEPPGREELAAAVTRSLAELPPADADLLTRKYHQAASVRELAAHFQLTETAIESRLARARVALRTAVFRLLKHEKL